MRLAIGPALALPGQRGMLITWVPVLLGIGIGLYLSLPREPETAEWGVLLAAAAAGAIAAWKLGPRGPIVWAFVLVLGGVLLCGLRTHQVSEPILSWRYYGPIEGRVIEVDRSASDKPRLTLDHVVLERVSPERTPARVRVSMHGDGDWIDPAPGQVVITTGHLSPPSGPAEPGGFDFRRMAFFERLGAVGYTRNPVLLLTETGDGLWIARLRHHISAAVRARTPGDKGAFAAAILTGDRSAIDADTLQALRDSNLAHLLAISGLHMGLLTGTVFFALRFALALVPGLALTWPLKKIAAMGALGAASFYLALSGGNVATQRAFVMAAVVLIAVVLDRRALTLRAVALAATILLVLRPEALAGPGFQMSFSATIALVVAFRILRDRGPRMPRWVAGAASVVISSAVAGLATAPVGAAHFNQSSSYGLLANVTSVPMMGTLVMPSAVAAAVLAPLGLAALPLTIMEFGIGWILTVAREVASWPGAVRSVPAPSGAVLPLWAIGALWLILWRGPARWAGLVPCITAAFLWVYAPRPALLIADTGGLVGLMGPDGRALSRPRGSSFVAGIWLENDGDAVDREIAAARDVDWSLGGVPIHHVTGRGGDETARDLCSQGGIVVTSAELPGLSDVMTDGAGWTGPTDTGNHHGTETTDNDISLAIRRTKSTFLGLLTMVGVTTKRPEERQGRVASAETSARAPCLLLDETVLRHTGAVSIDPGPTGLRIRIALDDTRPWSLPARRP